MNRHLLRYRARDFKTLVQRLANDGYIYIRGVLPIHKVLAARAAVARTVQEVSHIVHD